MIENEVLQKVKPGAKIRVWEKGAAAPFEGLVIARKHGSEPGATFAVRSTIAGVGVEKIFPIHSPTIAKVDIISSPRKVHRAKLYWVRKASGAKVRQRLKVSV